MDFVVLIVLIVVALGAGGAFTWQQTKTQGRFGSASSRPSARAAATRCRRSASRRRGTGAVGRLDLPECGCQVDRYGKERAAA